MQLPKKQWNIKWRHRKRIKLEIWGEKRNYESIVRLKLLKSLDGINLIIVDENGYEYSGGTILTILDSGRIRKQKMTSCLGFVTDDECKIKEVFK